MKTTYAVDLLHSPSDGTTVVLYGWVKARRRHNHVVFLDITDSTGSVQCVVEAGNKPAFELARRMNQETAVKITGVLADTGRANPQREIRVDNIEVIGVSTISVSPYPRGNIDIQDPRLQEQLLDKRHFYLRNEKFAAILKFRHVLTRIVHQWFHENGFIEIHAPVLTPTPLYDDRTAMAIKVHEQDVYLTQCVGFYLEQAVHALEKIYNIGPSFRAEESRSKRHLMEYWHIKAELAFVDFEDMASVVERFIHDVSEQCIREGRELANIIGTEICGDGLKTPFPRIDYAEAVEWLKTQGSDIEFGKSMGSDEETMLCQRFGDTPFWIVGIPRPIEPFPYVIDAADTRRTKTADLIASRGFGELLGIAEKIHSLSMLDERLAEKGKAGDARYEWLRDLRQYGCVPHGGFGMGLERFIRWLLQIPHVRDTIPFHRAFSRRIDP
ncbi:MAG: asparagine--tRNA ligase [Candidatus Paceibacterota bacterium]|nr:MAG: asparagine--tRNA ligase [Candidatus Paceibacterota bacterium]